MSGIPDPGGVSGTFAALERTSPIVESTTGDAPTTTSMRVANGTHTEHRAVLQLIRNNLADFEEFGLVAFEMRPRPAGQHGGGDVQIAILTEEHATLLLTYMRNSEIVRDFKKRLVREFSALRRGATPALPDRRALAQMVIEAEDRADEAERQRVIEQKGREAAESYARELEPKAQYVDDFVSTDDCILFRTVANQVGMSESALRELLTEKRWIYRQFIGRRFSKKAGKLVDEHEWRAYADKKHEFRLIPQHKAPRHHNNQLRQTLYVTPPGARAIRALVGTAVVSS